MPNISIAGSDVTFHAGGADTVLRAALRAGVGLPYECNSGGCGACKFEALEGDVETLWRAAPGLSARDAARGRRLACQSRPLTDLRIRTRPNPACVPVIPPARRAARFAGRAVITHDIAEFRFMADGPAVFLPGQFAMLALPGLNAARAYSMSNLANDEGEFHFQVRRVPGGAGSEILFDRLTPDAQIEIDAPYGLAYLRAESPRDIVCAAGGSGLAPMVSIARGAARHGLLANRQLHFFYGGRTARDICGETFLKDISAGGQIHFHPAISSPPAAGDPAWSGATGFVHEQLERVLGEDLHNFEFYFAGPPPMTQALHELLMLRFRVPFEQIHFDRFF